MKHYNIPEVVLLMVGQRRLLWRLTTRPGMMCPVDGEDRGRMMSASIRGHGGIGVSTPCRSDRPGGSVTADRFKVVRKGYITYAVRLVGLAGASDRNLLDQSSDCGVLERDILQLAIASMSQSDDDDRRPTMPRTFSREFYNTLRFFRTKKFVLQWFCSSSQNSVAPLSRHPRGTILQWVHNNKTCCTELARCPTIVLMVHKSKKQ